MPKKKEKTSAIKAAKSNDEPKVWNGSEWATPAEHATDKSEGKVWNGSEWVDKVEDDDVDG